MSSSLPFPILDEPRTRALVGCDKEALSVVREALCAQARGRVNQPAPWHLGLKEANGLVHVKGAHINGDSTYVIKLASSFFDNPAKGLPSGGGFSMVFDAATGEPRVFIADNGYLTDLRTGLAGAVAADALARADTETIAVIGAGTQARFQLRALLLVRSPRRLLIAARNALAAEELAREMRDLASWFRLAR